MKTVTVPPASAVKLVVKHAHRLDSLEADVAEIAADIGQVYKDAKADGINVAALRLARRIQRMDLVERQELLDAFDQYRLDMNLDAQGKLDFGDKATGDALEIDGTALIEQEERPAITDQSPKLLEDHSKVVPLKRTKRKPPKKGKGGASPSGEEGAGDDGSQDPPQAA